ncbi:MAG: hypothetical protein U0871_02210 [Gemmataceae bacterium]
MLRNVLCGLGVAWAATASAQTPVSVHPTAAPAMLPGTVVPAQANQPPVAMPAPAAKLPAAKSPADMSRPLGEILQSPLPTAPTVPPPTAAATPAPTSAAGCATCATPAAGDCATGGGGRNVLGRLKEWLCYKPAPRVLPVFTPTPYTAPARAYFTCRPPAMGCGQAVGCGQTGAGGSVAPARKTVKAAESTCTSGRCGTPFLRGHSFGLFGGCDPCRDSLLDRLLGRFSSDRGCHPVNCLSGTCGAGGMAITTPASGPLNCSIGCPPATAGVCGQRPYTYRFANPLCPPTAAGYGPAGLPPPPAATPAATPAAPTAMPAAPTPAPVGGAAPSVSKPFTNP